MRSTFLLPFPVRQCERGITIVEAMLGTFLLLGAILVGVDLLRVTYNALVCQYVASRAIREIIVDKPLDGTPRHTPNTGTARATFFEGRLIDSASVFGVDLSDSEVCINVVNPAAPNAACNANSDDAGTPLDLIRVRIEHPVNLVVPSVIGFHNGRAIFGITRTINVSSLALGKNEPF